MHETFAGQVVHAQGHLLGVVQQHLWHRGLHQLTWTTIRTERGAWQEEVGGGAEREKVKEQRLEGCK